MINQISKDPTSQAFEGHIILDQTSLVQKCPLATKSDFWVELEMQKTVQGTIVCLLVQNSSKMSEELRKHVDHLKPIIVSVFGVCCCVDVERAADDLRATWRRVPGDVHGAAH